MHKVPKGRVKIDGVPGPEQPKIDINMDNIFAVFLSIVKKIIIRRISYFIKFE